MSSSYVVCIGGGTKGEGLTKIWGENFPEQGEYYNICGLTNHLISTGQVQPENLTVLFGNGEASPQVLRQSRLGNFFSNLLFRGKSSHTEIKSPFPVPHEAATLKNIEAVFERLAKSLKPSDKLSILLSGHGSLFKGVVLWNGADCKEFLSPVDLHRCLDKLDRDINITMYISSSHSGQYFPLTRRNVAILTTSGSETLSRYSEHTGCEHLQKLFGFDVWNFILEDTQGRNYLSHYAHNAQRFLKKYEGVTLLQRQAMEAMNKNFYASDSLSDFIDQTLASKVGPDRLRMALERMQRITSTRNFKRGAELGFAGLVVSDPSGFFQTVWLGKVGLAVGKAALPVIKVVGWAFMRGGLLAIQDTAKQTPMYKHWFTHKDRRLIRRVEAFLQGQEDKIRIAAKRARSNPDMVTILQDLNKIRQFPVEEGKPLVHYHYLYYKAWLFLSLATPEELETLISIHKTLSENNAVGKITRAPKTDRDLY